MQGKQATAPRLLTRVERRNRQWELDNVFARMNALLPIVKGAQPLVEGMRGKAYDLACEKSLDAHEAACREMKDLERRRDYLQDELESGFAYGRVPIDPPRPGAG